MCDASRFKWRIDLHVHTRRYSPCAESLDPLRLPDVVSRRGLHGVLITEHDHLWPPLQIAELNQTSDGARIFGGVEISSCNGHFILIGLEELGCIHPGISAHNLIREARDQDAAVIWAHPQLRYHQIKRPLSLLEMPQGIDALEVASTVTFGQAAKAVRAQAVKTGCAEVGGSDAHALGHVGGAFTMFERMPENEKELAEIIRSGCCRAMFADDWKNI